MQFFKTPDELEVELGEQLRAERLRLNLTMHDVALRAGISEQTIRSLENGAGGRLNSFIRVMKALGKEEWLVSFRPAVRISPMDIAKRSGKQRLRATRSVIAQPSSQKDHV
ncbi:helix-turn-helix domain-containing protein [Comamonas sp. Y33R10-2]|uniref:helix-turn-helix domain-containing protein n=1 Tax=Comamonas sp. Y33R10-2 TaxID=2853257 RepID=UPI001C5CC189|nr:helix-turn-helix domain-containing protein [Comamonas sp. Y33R10-2]QXZ08390.1 helix-turn-helix domain-containing protein [Comamonas sp. Y33R10-2]